jgi:hypothetical protein
VTANRLFVLDGRSSAAINDSANIVSEERPSMGMILEVLGVCVLAIAVVGCAIHRRVEPVPRLDSREMCIVNNPNVREGFLAAYQAALAGKGFRAKLVEPSAAPDACPLTSTYTANWRWDLALYMAFADITVYSNGKKVGRAVYDSLGGGGNLGKFINAEEKIKELVDLLFPAPGPPG